jgi:hypothetical protein
MECVSVRVWAVSLLACLVWYFFLLKDHHQPTNQPTHSHHPHHPPRLIDDMTPFQPHHQPTNPFPPTHTPNPLSTLPG